MIVAVGKASLPNQWTGCFDQSVASRPVLGLGKLVGPLRSAQVLESAGSARSAPAPSAMLSWHRGSSIRCRMVATYSLRWTGGLFTPIGRSTQAGTLRPFTFDDIPVGANSKLTAGGALIVLAPRPAITRTKSTEFWFHRVLFPNNRCPLLWVIFFSKSCYIFILFIL